MDRARLEALLAEVGSDVSFPETPPIVEDVMRRLIESPPVRTRRPRPRLVFATALLVIAAFMVVPGSRRAVADLFGLGGVAITTAPELPHTAIAGEFFGEELTLHAAQAAVDFTLLVPDGIEGPDAVYFDEAVLGGLVTLAYQPGRNSFGLVITEMLGSVYVPLLEKAVEPDEIVVPVEVGGGDGFWIEGPHALFVLGESGEGRVEPARLVGSTLIYRRGDVTIRIESALDLEGALEVAESLRPYDP